MSQKPGNLEQSSLPLKLEAVKSLAQRLLEVARALPETDETLELIRCTDLIADIDFDGLVQDAKELASEASQPSLIEKFRQEINLREQKMHEFKLSLADSVIELKNAQKAVLSANERNADLAGQISQMQLHSKDLSLRLTSTTNNLEKRESELETARKELDELRSRAYQLKSQNADYEDHLKKSGEQVKMVLEDQKAAISGREKAQKDLEHVLTSNRELKSALDNLEMREKELVETVNSLQKERNHLHSRLNALLTGVCRTVSHDQSPGSGSSSSVLEPVNMAPYLPFCFPERLPAAIKFRREIGMSFPAAYSRRAHRHPPAFLSLERHANPSLEVVRTQNRPPRVKSAPNKELALSLSMFSLKTTVLKFEPVRKPDHSASLPRSFDAPMNDKVVYFRQIWWQKTTKTPLMNMKIDRQTGFPIIANSLELFLHFLISTFARQNYDPGENPLPHTIIAPKPVTTFDRLNFSINFQETLAFRHRLQLKSTKLDTPRITILQSFKRGNKLKSVLEMFGNTISSIVHRFESIPNSRSDNGENK